MCVFLYMCASVCLCICVRVYVCVVCVCECVCFRVDVDVSVCVSSMHSFVTFLVTLFICAYLHAIYVNNASASSDTRRHTAINASPHTNGDVLGNSVDNRTRNRSRNLLTTVSADEFYPQCIRRHVFGPNS